MPAYDPLLDYLQKNQWTWQNTCLTLLNGYKHKTNAYGALNDLVQRKIIERKVEDGVIFYRLRVIPRPMPQRLEGEEVFMQWTILYRYFVRYGAQHFSAPGRVKFMSIMRLWIEQYRRQIQFAAMLIDLIDNEPPRQVYMELHEGLKKAGWYDSEYDAVNVIDDIIKILNSDHIENFLGISDESWQSLHDYDGLGRVNNAVEHRRPPEPNLETQPRFPIYRDANPEFEEMLLWEVYQEYVKRNGASN